MFSSFGRCLAKVLPGSTRRAAKKAAKKAAAVDARACSAFQAQLGTVKTMLRASPPVAAGSVLLSPTPPLSTLSPGSRGYTPRAAHPRLERHALQLPWVTPPPATTGSKFLFGAWFDFLPRRRPFVPGDFPTPITAEQGREQLHSPRASRPDSRKHAPCARAASVWRADTWDTRTQHHLSSHRQPCPSFGNQGDLRGSACPRSHPPHCTRLKATM